MYYLAKLRVVNGDDEAILQLSGSLLLLAYTVGVSML